ncbi:hypothetical protein WJX74_002083 [Apatococcus lobatus]|uniref:Uncharacterized protein n=1 Tax=Apatococcus lobatus TaxID=904363 RepID=A0AAW1RU52_9CHLO
MPLQQKKVLGALQHEAKLQELLAEAHLLQAADGKGTSPKRLACHVMLLRELLKGVAFGPLQTLMELLLPELIASLYSPYLLTDPTGAPQPSLQERCPEAHCIPWYNVGPASFDAHQRATQAAQVQLEASLDKVRQECDDLVVEARHQTGLVEVRVEELKQENAAAEARAATNLAEVLAQMEALRLEIEGQGRTIKTLEATLVHKNAQLRLVQDDQAASKRSDAWLTPFVQAVKKVIDNPALLVPEPAPGSRPPSGPRGNSRGQTPPHMPTLPEGAPTCGTAPAGAKDWPKLPQVLLSSPSPEASTGQIVPPGKAGVKVGNHAAGPSKPTDSKPTGRRGSVQSAAAPADRRGSIAGLQRRKSTNPGGPLQTTEGSSAVAAPTQPARPAAGQPTSAVPPQPAQAAQPTLSHSIPAAAPTRLTAAGGGALAQTGSSQPTAAVPTETSHAGQPAAGAPAPRPTFAGGMQDALLTGLLGAGIEPPMAATDMPGLDPQGNADALRLPTEGSGAIASQGSGAISTLARRSSTVSSKGPKLGKGKQGSKSKGRGVKGRRASVIRAQQGTAADAPDDAEGDAGGDHPLGEAADAAVPDVIEKPAAEALSAAETLQDDTAMGDTAAPLRGPDAEVAKLIQQLGMLIDLEQAPVDPLLRPTSAADRLAAPEGAIPNLTMQDFPQGSRLAAADELAGRLEKLLSSKMMSLVEPGAAGLVLPTFDKPTRPSTAAMDAEGASSRPGTAENHAGNVPSRLRPAGTDVLKIPSRPGTAGTDMLKVLSRPGTGDA